VVRKRQWRMRERVHIDNGFSRAPAADISVAEMGSDDETTIMIGEERGGGARPWGRFAETGEMIMACREASAETAASFCNS
jgi:hypothetical protein